MQMSLEAEINDFLRNAQFVATLCNQWGDSGKGKIAEMIAAYWSDVDARGSGGHNAGHSFYIDGKEVIFHLLPVGIVYQKEKKDKVSILGNGMVIDLKALNKEMDWMDKEGFPYDNLMISQDAHVIMPYHQVEDRKQATQVGGKIGTTGRGIGPCYADKTARRGIRIGDLSDKSLVVDKINKLKQYYPDQKINTEELVEKLQPFIERIKQYVRNTNSEMQRLLEQGKKVQLEGAQGLLLSSEHGTYPYVTSSDCSLNGTASGVGLSAKDVDKALGLIKYPMMTRVGAGAFPSELGGWDSDDYCARGLEHDIFYEVEHYLRMPLDLDKIRKLQRENNEKELLEHKAKVYDYIKAHREDVVKLMNLSDPFMKGVGIRLAAWEYGATTGRPRRIGWTDAIAAKYAVTINGPLFVLTKPDTLAGCEEFKICKGYETRRGTIHTRFNREDKFLRSVNPLFDTYSGYSDISEIRTYSDLPEYFIKSVREFEDFTRGKVVMISNGPEREQTILRGMY